MAVALPLGLLAAIYMSELATPAVRSVFKPALEILAGVPTILFQVYNGLLVGALGSVFFSDPWPFEFLAWILPHGIPEFTAITLCAAAGLLLGGAVALPGRRRRRNRHGLARYRARRGPQPGSGSPAHPLHQRLRITR